MPKTQLGIFFGGRSPEHEISIRSALSVIRYTDKNRFDVHLFAIRKDGAFHHQLISNPENIPASEEELKEVFQTGRRVVCIPGQKNQFGDLKKGDSFRIDVAFPVLHGAFGEDGSIQGLFRTLDLPYVGPDQLGSSVGMDKDATKRLVRDGGILTAPWVTLYSHQKESVDHDQIIEQLGLPLFVKPATLGSSVGVYRAESREKLVQWIERAFQFDRKILVESAIQGREIECAVLGNEFIEASPPGEIVATDGFYSFDEKYSKQSTTGLIAPAELSPGKNEELSALAKKVFTLLGCEGLSRVDFFLTEDGSFYLNEINTLPGFTSISMYPRLWEVGGRPYSKLITDLIELAIARYERDQAFHGGNDPE